MFGALGHVRKEAYVLREVMASIMDLVVRGREETGNASARVLSAGLGNRNNSLNMTTAQGTVGIRENERTEGNESILLIVKHVCKVHGIDVEAVKLLESNAPSRESYSSQSEDADEEENLQSLQEPYGWPELQLDIIREAIAVAEALPGMPSLASIDELTVLTTHRLLGCGSVRAVLAEAIASGHDA